MKIFLFILAVLVNLVAIDSFATHIRGGQLLYDVNGVKASVRLIIYSNRASVDAGVDDPTATIDWGDGISSVLPRASKAMIYFDTYENIYT
ncbi:MAG: hypothetical protein NVV82_04660 [Sporocytophaga sp.]|nr:hypothetical protein [Sporocytophaga sp.]